MRAIKTLPRGHIFKKTVVITPRGTDGSAVATRQVDLGGPGILRAVAIDFTSQAATTDIQILLENSSGAAAFTWTSSATDTTGASTGAAVAITTDGVDEANNTVANAGVGAAFAKGLYIDVAQADQSSTGTTPDKPIVIHMWIEADVAYRTVTLTTVGSDTAAVATDLWNVGKPGVLKFLRITTSSGQSATLDAVIKVDSSAGATVFTATDLATNDIDGSVAATAAPIGNDALDEAAGAVTNFVQGGCYFTNGLYCSIAQADSAETVVLEYWVEV